MTFDEWHQSQLPLMTLAETVVMSPYEYAKRAWEAAQAARWQPIETAPKDRSSFLVYCPERRNVYCVYRFEDENEFRVFNSGGRVITDIPTHWAPLPAPPQEKE